MTTETIAWEEPPPRRGGPAPDPVELRIATALRKHPGSWAVVERFDSHHDALLLQRRIRRGAPGSAWAHGFDATVRKTGERVWKVYARVPEGDDA